jgi:hypothetical protein
MIPSKERDGRVNWLKALVGADSQTFCRPLPYHLGTAPYCRVETASRPRGSSVEIGAGDGGRTRDIDLGKVALYH